MKKIYKVLIITALSVVSIVVVIIFWKIICSSFTSIGLNFSKDNPNGEFFKVILSILGGLGIVWGLWINSRRIQEQSKENQIAECSNNDKRFSDAIGYLGDDRTSIVLGGIYSLFQLAKEDGRYRSIVANLLCSYLREKSKNLYAEMQILENQNEDVEDDDSLYSYPVPIIVETITNLLFNDKDLVFKDQVLDLSHISLTGITFSKKIVDCSFDFSKLTECYFESDVIKCGFYNAELRNCIFEKNVENTDFNFSGLFECNFFTTTLEIIRGGQLLGFNGSKIDNCTFHGTNLYTSNFNNSNIINTTIYTTNVVACEFKYLTTNKLEFKNTQFCNTEIEDLPQIVYIDCKNLPIKFVNEPNCESSDGKTYK